MPETCTSTIVQKPFAIPFVPSDDKGGVSLLDIPMDDMTDLMASLPRKTPQDQHIDREADNEDLEMGEFDSDLITLSDDDEEAPTAGLAFNDCLLKEMRPNQPVNRKASADDLQMGDVDTDLVFLSDDDDEEASMADPSSHGSTSETSIVAEAEDANLRLELFTNICRGQKVELKNLTTPPECRVYRDQERELADIYLHNTIFTVKVWINYDAAETRFFAGDRATACGKLRLPADERTWLLEIDQSILNLRHVRFDICTPFRSLAHLNVDIVPRANRSARLRIKGNLVGEGTPLLCEYLNVCTKSIHENGMLDPATGLTVSDLECFAQSFRRHPTCNDGRDCWEEPAYGGGEWAGVEEPPRRYPRTISRYNVR